MPLIAGLTAKSASITQSPALDATKDLPLVKGIANDLTILILQPFPIQIAIVS